MRLSCEDVRYGVNGGFAVFEIEAAAALRRSRLLYLLGETGVAALGTVRRMQMLEGKGDCW